MSQEQSLKIMGLEKRVAKLEAELATMNEQWSKAVAGLSDRLTAYTVPNPLNEFIDRPTPHRKPGRPRKNGAQAQT